MAYNRINTLLVWDHSSNRKPYCCINGFVSELMDINIGVPQGSCLGPLLFLLYINDLPLAVENFTVAIYADNYSLSYRYENIYQLNDAVE